MMQRAIKFRIWTGNSFKTISDEHLELHRCFHSPCMYSKIEYYIVFGSMTNGFMPKMKLVKLLETFLNPPILCRKRLNNRSETTYQIWYQASKRWLLRYFNEVFTKR